jgi:proline iminopeptidase
VSDPASPLLSREIYPAIEPYRSGMLRVSPLHTIYYEETGHPNGKPVVMLHGGPGGGSSPFMRRFHDPERYRIVLFDQRGCGRSTPHAELAENTTWDLVADIERLRTHLGIERWQVMGGSWGSALALAYAQTHPDRVTELVLRGLFTVRRAELLWFYQEGASWLFPDAFAPFVEHIPPVERGDLISAYHRRLTDPDPAVRRAAARIWSVWEGSTLSLFEDPERVSKFGNEDYAVAFARIETHYFVHGGFLRQDDQLIADLSRIRHLPGRLVHGRYDCCTPVRIAFDVKRAWPEAELTIVPDAGHAMTEPGIARALVAATEAFKNH